MGSQYNLKKIQDLCFWEAKEGEMSCKPFFIDMGERKLKEALDIHSFTSKRIKEKQNDPNKLDAQRQI